MPLVDVFESPDAVEMPLEPSGAPTDSNRVATEDNRLTVCGEAGGRDEGRASSRKEETR
jgi:hypothetical protein